MRFGREYYEEDSRDAFEGGRRHRSSVLFSCQHWINVRTMLARMCLRVLPQEARRSRSPGLDSITKAGRYREDWPEIILEPALDSLAAGTYNPLELHTAKGTGRGPAVCAEMIVRKVLKGFLL
jgi:hypothetical protein